MHSTHPTPVKHYFSSIDGLRLFAAVNIILFHAEGMGGLAGLQGQPYWLFSIIKGPAFHASLFFILGGFIYTIKYAGHAGQFRTRRFLVSRFKNLFPLHAAMTLAMVPFVLLGTAGQFSLGKLLFSCGMHLSLLWPFFPFHSYSLNTPSWAIAAFFLCYLAFGTVLRWVVRLKRISHVLGFILLCMLPSVLWVKLYMLTGCKLELYQFFHVFPLPRLFEFILGMLLARLYLLQFASRFKPQAIPAVVIDLVIGGALCLLYFNVRARWSMSPAMIWFSYHVLLVPLYLLLVYGMALGRGGFARLMRLRFVRALGRSSFYPYLLHVPLISWICWIAERYFGYRHFLHEPLNLLFFIVALYGISSLYQRKVGKKRKASYRVAAEPQ